MRLKKRVFLTLFLFNFADCWHKNFTFLARNFILYLFKEGFYEIETNI